MGRELKRVPLEYDYEIGITWDGYCPSIERFQELFGEEYPVLYEYNCASNICRKCEDNFGACLERADYCFWHNPINKEKWYNEVPTGEGYQLWSTTTEGHPMSPVFETLDKLCEYLGEEEISWFAGESATKEQWLNKFEMRGY